MPASPELAVRDQLQEEIGPRMCNAFMAELRALHLGAPAPTRSILAGLQTAFAAVATDKS